MEKSFDSTEYLRFLAQELIINFDLAGKATTPVLVGSSRENATRKKLESVFPPYIGVGTGCVIDTFGYTSKQTDVILFEKDICPVFSINDTQETTYYPCEGVIAVGEIKSTLTTEELKKSFKNIASIKSCQRFYPTNEAETLYRNFGSTQTIIGAEKFDQKENFKNQIYGFILCQKIGLKLDTFLDRYTELVNEYENHLIPNVLISLEEGVFAYYNKNTQRLSEFKNDSTGVYNVKNQHGDFQFLLFRLNEFLRVGKPSPVIPLEKYIMKEITLSNGGTYKDF